MGGNIIASVDKGFSPTWMKINFDLTRPSIIALYEFAPGNLIYANGGKYRTSFFHFPIRDDIDPNITTIQPDSYEYSPSIRRINEKGQLMSGYAMGDIQNIDGIPISNLDLAFLTQVSDEDEYRFRLASRIVGYLQQAHRGGKAYDANGMQIQHLNGQKVRFVNVGPISNEEKLNLGFPICIVCGATRSPFATDTEITNFVTHHKEKTCGQEPKNLALSTDADVDGILFKGFHSGAEAINYAEAIRMGATVKLEMNRDDLGIILLPLSEQEFDVLLFDPMPGGSGLLSQIIDRWKEIVDSAIIALNCPNQCLKSCYVCMRTYRNIFFHEEFDRTVASNLLLQFTNQIRFLHDIPAVLSIQTQSGTSTNWNEQMFRNLFQQHGFPPFIAQHSIALMGSIPQTTPDFFYEDPSQGKKIAIYIDGLSQTIHGNANRAQTDKLIDNVLENMLQIKVVRIPASAKTDPKILAYYLQQIGDYLK
jgi:hypothetical protein